MAYLHCHICKWEQDDFWDENYNPITFLENSYKDILFNESLDEVFQVDRYIGNDIEGWKHYSSKITKRQNIISSLKRAIEAIDNMIWRTQEEFERKNPKRIYPNCGKQTLNID